MYLLSCLRAGGGIAPHQELKHDSSAIGWKTNPHFTQETIQTVEKHRLLGERGTRTNGYFKRSPTWVGKRAQWKTWGKWIEGGREGGKRREGKGREGEGEEGGRVVWGKVHYHDLIMFTWITVRKRKVLLDLRPLKGCLQVSTYFLQEILPKEETEKR